MAMNPFFVARPKLALLGLSEVEGCGEAASDGVSFPCGGIRH